MSAPRRDRRRRGGRAQSLRRLLVGARRRDHCRRGGGRALGRRGDRQAQAGRRVPRHPDAGARRLRGARRARRRRDAGRRVRDGVQRPCREGVRRERAGLSAQAVRSGAPCAARSIARATGVVPAMPMEGDVCSRRSRRSRRSSERCVARWRHDRTTTAPASARQRRLRRRLPDRILVSRRGHGVFVSLAGRGLH